jgi:hypothetical protein
MKFGDAFTYVFQDPDWFKKLIIPGLVMLIPIIGQIAVLGWSLQVTLNVTRNAPNPLPEFDFGRDLGRGFKAFVVGLVYGIPIFVLYLPIIVLSAIAANSGDDTMVMLIGIGSACFGLLMLLYSIVLGVVLPAAYTRTVVEDSIGAGLAFGDVFGLVRKALVPYLLVLVGSFAASFVGSLGSIACAVGVLVTMPYAFAILGHLYGQAYMEAKELRTY